MFLNTCINISQTHEKCLLLFLLSNQRGCMINTETLARSQHQSCRKWEQACGISLCSVVRCCGPLAGTPVRYMYTQSRGRRLCNADSGTSLGKFYQLKYSSPYGLREWRVECGRILHLNTSEILTSTRYMTIGHSDDNRISDSDKTLNS